jgi:hypothetical protein
MDNRREPRFEADQVVGISVLAECEAQLEARVKNASGRGLAIETSGPILPGTALKIEFKDTVVLGEAVYCRDGKGSYLVGVELDQVLCGLTELGKKLQEFAGLDASGGQVPQPLNDGNGKNHQQTDNQ